MTPKQFERNQTSELARLHRVKQLPPLDLDPLGPALLELFDKSIKKTHNRLGRLTDIWLSLVPPTLNDHCALQGFTRGTLTVYVDNGSYLYELKQLLLAGLQQQLLLAGKSSGLRKISLRLGQWDVPEDRPSEQSVRDSILGKMQGSCENSAPRSRPIKRAGRDF